MEECFARCLTINREKYQNNYPSISMYWDNSHLTVSFQLNRMQQFY